MMMASTTRNTTRKRLPTAVVVVTMIMMVAMISFLLGISAVAAMPLIEDDVGDGITSSKGEIIETTISTISSSTATSTSTATISASASASVSSTNNNDCIDDSNFRFKGKGCKWVGGKKKKSRRKKQKKNRNRRCKKMYLGMPLSERCRNTCNYNGCNRLTVGVYYYPWWGKDFHQGNPNNPDRYLREQLVDPQQLPALGRYNDTEPDVIAKHLKWSRQYNIDLWVSSWWGEDRREDLVIKNNILTHPQLGDHKIAIFYETTGRIREKDGDFSLENVRPDLEYLCRQYFSHPNYYYYQTNNNNHKRPVFFVYLTRKLEQLGLLPEVIALMRQGATDGGCNDIFIVGDHVFQGPPTIGEMAYISFDILDGVTNYDVYGSMRGGKNGGYVGSREKVTEYYQEQQQWKDIAQNQQCSFIPCASPGFNDRGVRPEKERIPLSRKLNEDAAEGSLFQAALQEARKLVDSSVQNLLMVNSFNEWHEDTQIEPCVAVDGSKGKDSSTNLPNNLTYGLQYEGYDKLYLEILKDETETWDVSSIITPSSVSSVATPNNVDTSSSTTTEGSITTISDTIGSVVF